MILTKNKLKNKRVKLDDDDEFNYMNFLRFKHLIDRRERQRNRNNKATQTEQHIETNNDKATNTVDELLEPFRLKVRSENFSDNDASPEARVLRDKSTQTTARRDQETSPRYDVNFKDYILKGSDRSFSSRWKGQRLKDRRDMMVQVYMASLRGDDTPPDTTDDDEPSNALKALGIATNVALYGTGLGVRLGLGATQMLSEGALNLYDAMQSEQQEQQEEAEDIEVIEVESSPPISVNSSPPITVDSSPLPTPTQISTPTSPRSSNESVGYPRKKSK